MLTSPHGASPADQPPWRTLQVIGIRDLGAGVDTSQPDGRPALPWQRGDMMITYTLEGPAVLTLRASGTEPKLKYYIEVGVGSGAGLGFGG